MLTNAEKPRNINGNPVHCCGYPLAEPNTQLSISTEFIECILFLRIKNNLQ